MLSQMGGRGAVPGFLFASAEIIQRETADSDPALLKREDKKDSQLSAGILLRGLAGRGDPVLAA